MGKYGKSVPKDEWITPLWLTQALGPFDLDPCAPHPASAPWSHAPHSFYLPDYDGLTQPWHGRVFLNPPYLKQAAWPWLDKLAAHGRGIALVNSTTETAGFRHAAEQASLVLFLSKRISFFNTDGSPSGTPMQGSALLAFGALDAQVLQTCSLKGLRMLVAREEDRECQQEMWPQLESA